MKASSSTPKYFEATQHQVPQQIFLLLRVLKSLHAASVSVMNRLID